MPKSRCPDCDHPWKLHDYYGCTYSTITNGAFDDCQCERRVPAGHRD